MDADPVCTAWAERRRRLTITTDGGTTFDVRDKQVTITRHDQPVCVVPLADLQEFLGLYQIEEDEDDDLE